MAGNVNLTFGSELDPQDGNPTIWKKFLAKFIKRKNLVTYVKTLSKCPGGHSILHRVFKLNSKKSAGKYKKNLNALGSIDFPAGSLTKISRINT